MDDWELRPARDFGLTFRERLLAIGREDGFVEVALRSAWWWALRCQFAVWNRLTIHRPENLPRCFPFILVANHTSHLDALVLTASLPWWLRPGTCPLAAGDVFFESPFTGAFAANILNALPVWRKRHADRSFKGFRQRLLEGSSGYVLFPEGARSRDGRMAAFKPGVGMLVAGSNVPVVPCRLEGCREAFPPGRRIPGRGRIEVHVGKPMEFSTLENNRAGWERIASELERGVIAARR